LLSRSNFTAEAEFERPQDRSHDAAVFRQYHSEAEFDDTNSGLLSPCGGRLPLTTNAGQKSFARAALFINQLVAATSVEANRRGVNERHWFARQVRHRLAQQPRAVDAAVQNATLLFFRPSSIGNSFAG